VPRAEQCYVPDFKLSRHLAALFEKSDKALGDEEIRHRCRNVYRRCLSQDGGVKLCGETAT